MTNTKHFLIVFSMTNEYKAICGYESKDAKEFTSVSNPSNKGVTCDACLEKLNKSVVIVKETE